jgi:guanylate kinase
MATPSRDNAATHRTVVLLRPAEKKRLDQLARQENVSASEIVRRSIQAYESMPGNEQEEFKTVIAQMNQSLDEALAQIRSDRVEIAANLEAMRQRGAHTA